MERGKIACYHASFAINPTSVPLLFLYFSYLYLFLSFFFLFLFLSFLLPRPRLRSTVSYRELSYFHFNADESFSVDGRRRRRNSPKALVRVLNLPLLTVLDRAKSQPYVERVVLDSIIVETQSKLFVLR